MNRDIFISPEVDPQRISPEAVLFPGTRISGEKTSIGPGCVLGAEGPVTVENCQLGRNVHLKGGAFSGAVFLNGSGMGCSAHVRAGTVLEEEAAGAHCVGLKQTILFPFVTLGSLINFCDVLMAGGTGRKNHSEVGSSYVHFNFTPHQDKATASLIGDVPRGVLLNRRPVFLGGQGGLVGPARIAYGTVLAAGGICRKDVPEENRLILPAAPAEQALPYEQGVYKSIDRIVRNSLTYIGNIAALQVWYEKVRIHFVCDAFDRACYQGVLNNLDRILKERTARLEQLAGKMEYSVKRLEQETGRTSPESRQQKEFAQSWRRIHEALENRSAPEPPEELTGELEKADKEKYIVSVQNLSEAARVSSAAWLQKIVVGAENLWNERG